MSFQGEEPAADHGIFYRAISQNREQGLDSIEGTSRQDVPSSLHVGMVLSGARNDVLAGVLYDVNDAWVVPSVVRAVQYHVTGFWIADLDDAERVEVL